MKRSQYSPLALSWLQNLLEERFGYSFELSQDGAILQLKLSGSEGTICFDNLQEVFHQSTSDFPCKYWNPSAEGYAGPIDDAIPAPSNIELPNPLITYGQNCATVHYDILGLTYWMLSRLEEVGRTDLDEHSRFPAISSHAYKQGYLERPIVDEWLAILGQVMQKVWPQLELKKHHFSMKVSHDVDHPTRYGFAKPKTLLRAMGGDVLKRKQYANAMRAPWIRLATRRKLHPKDPYNTFDWIMDQSERHGLTSAFYFMCGRTDPVKDCDYEIEHPAMRELLKRIHARGHEIGLHPSYGSYQKPEIIVQEAQRLKAVCSSEGIEQAQWGGRMHYLRWEQPTTIHGWEMAGMDYDSTLGYADRPGFRCGTCFEYPAFDPVAQKTLHLRIRPLIVMECSVMAEKYLGLSTSEDVVKKISHLKDCCKTVNGCFTLLWHNSYFNGIAQRSIYRELFVE